MLQESTAAAPAVLPAGWPVSTVQVTETTTYDVLVAHPPGAAPTEIATAAYKDYKDTLHPDQVFPAVVGEDEVSIDGQDYDYETTPSWATIPHGATVDAIEASTRATPAAAATSVALATSVGAA